MAFNYANVLNNIAQAIQQPRQSQQASQPQQSSGSKQGAGGSFADLLKQASASQQPQQQEAVPVYYEQPSRSSGSNKISTTSNEKEDSKKKESKESEESTPFRRGRSSIFMPEQGVVSSGGGKIDNLSPQEYLDKIREYGFDSEEAQALRDDFNRAQSEKMGESVGMVVPGNAPIAGGKFSNFAARVLNNEADALKAIPKAKLPKNVTEPIEQAEKAGKKISKQTKKAAEKTPYTLLDANYSLGSGIPTAAAAAGIGAVGAASLAGANPDAYYPTVSWDNSGTMMVPVIENNEYGLGSPSYYADPNLISDEVETSDIVDEKPAADEKSDKRELTSEYQPSNLTQMQEYYNWLDTDDGRAFLERYGDEFGADNQGYTNLRASQNRDAWADVMGFGEGEGIGNWQNRYTNSGVDLSDEHAMDNLMEYLYGDQAANLYDWVGNNDYNQSRVGISGDAYDEAALWFANQNPELMQAYNQEYAGGNDTFNADDFAYYALLTRLTNPEYGFNDVSIDELNRAAQAAGEGNTFGLTEQGLLGLMNDEGTSEESDRNNARRYLMNDNTVLNPWLQGDNPLMDQQMIDSVLAAYNAPKQQGSKESK